MNVSRIFLTVGTVILAMSLITSATAQQLVPPPAEAGGGALIEAEFVFSLEDRPTPDCHASTIVETESGLVAAWFGGIREKHPEVAIYVARKVGEKWLKPVEVVDGSEGEETEFACWNPVLFQPADGPLMLFYKVGPSPSEWWGMLTTSSDDGKTWSAPRRLGTDKALGEPNTNLIGPVKNKPIQLADGTIICPSSSEHDTWRVHFERSRDGGKTWEVVGPLATKTTLNAIQPSILTYADGRMQVLCRSREGIVTTSWSDDRGRTWSPLAATSLPNPNSGTDAITLADGRQLIVYNHTVRGGEFPRGRNMLNVATSLDGETWEIALTLERSEGEFSYPAVIQSTDGHVHATYTWKRDTVKHVTIDPGKLK